MKGSLGCLSLDFSYFPFASSQISRVSFYNILRMYLIFFMNTSHLGPDIWNIWSLRSWQQWTDLQWNPEIGLLGNNWTIWNWKFVRDLFGDWCKQRQCHYQARGRRCRFQILGSRKVQDESTPSNAWIRRKFWFHLFILFIHYLSVINPFDFFETSDFFQP